MMMQIIYLVGGQVVLKAKLQVAQNSHIGLSDMSLHIFNLVNFAYVNNVGTPLFGNMNWEKNILEWHSDLDKDDDVGEDAGDGGPLNGEQTHAEDRAQPLDLLQRLKSGWATNEPFIKKIFWLTHLQIQSFYQVTMPVL